MDWFKMGRCYWYRCINNNMTCKEETYVLDTIKEIQETIRSPKFKQLINKLTRIILYLNKLLKLLIFRLNIIHKKMLMILI